jgi:hypothetical protein
MYAQICVGVYSPHPRLASHVTGIAQPFPAAFKRQGPGTNATSVPSQSKSKPPTVFRGVPKYAV